MHPQFRVFSQYYTGYIFSLVFALQPIENTRSSNIQCCKNYKRKWRENTGREIREFSTHSTIQIHTFFFIFASFVSTLKVLGFLFCGLGFEKTADWLKGSKFKKKYMKVHFLKYLSFTFSYIRSINLII